MRRLLTTAALAALLLVAPACGGEDAASSVRDRVDELQQDAERLRDRARTASQDFGRRVREVLDEIRQAVPEASLPTPQVREPTALEAYMEQVLQSVDGYWTRTLRASGLEEPRIAYYWVPPGGRVLTSCRVVADDRAAFYCWPTTRSTSPHGSPTRSTAASPTTYRESGPVPGTPSASSASPTSSLTSTPTTSSSSSASTGCCGPATA